MYRRVVETSLGIQRKRLQRCSPFGSGAFVLIKDTLVISCFVATEKFRNRIRQLAIGRYFQFLEQNIDILLEASADRTRARILELYILALPGADVLDASFHFLNGRK